MISRITSKNLVGAFIAFMVLTLSLFVSAPVYARTVGATLSGTVTDPSRAPIPNVQLTMRNTATSVTAGFYLVPDLLPGSYDVIFSGPGFTTLVESNVVLVVGGQRALNRSMQVGQVTQKLEVTATAEAVQLTSSTLRDEVNATTMRELPVENRDFTSLANLKPGVAPVRTQPLAFSPSGDRGVRGFGNAISDAGHRPEGNTFRSTGSASTITQTTLRGVCLAGLWVWWDSGVFHPDRQLLVGVENGKISIGPKFTKVHVRQDRKWQFAFVQITPASRSNQLRVG